MKVKHSCHRQVEIHHPDEWDDTNIAQRQNAHPVKKSKMNFRVMTLTVIMIIVIAFCVAKVAGSAAEIVISTK